MTVPYLKLLGFTARGRHERCRSADAFLNAQVWLDSKMVGFCRPRSHQNSGSICVSRVPDSPSSLKSNPEVIPVHDSPDSATCSNVRILVSPISCREQPRRKAQSWSEYFSRTEHDKDKALEVIKPEDAPNCVTGLWRPSKTANEWITRGVCDGRVVRARCLHANCILNNRPPGPDRPLARTKTNSCQPYFL